MFMEFTVINALSKGFIFHSAQNRSFRRHPSQPISWLGTEPTKPNTKNKPQRNKMI